MALSADDLLRLDALFGDAAPGPGVLAGIRTQFPDLSLTQCDASDIDCEPPFRVYPRFSVYLVDGAGHCWSLTGDPGRATGLVVVQHRAAVRPAGA